MASTLINDDAFTDMLGKKLNEAMLKAAEPILQDALKEIEEKMRAQMASRLISFIENSFSIERMGSDIRIIVKQANAVLSRVEET